MNKKSYLPPWLFMLTIVAHGCLISCAMAGGPDGKRDGKADSRSASSDYHQPATFPNILFFLAEDQGAQLGYLKTPGLETPNIDALARKGLYFKNAFVAYPVCSASKASIYTGLFGHTNGILNNTHNFHKPASQVTAAERALKLAKINRIRDSCLTLTQILKANGFYQGVTHKLHVLPNSKFPYDEFLHGSPQEIQGFLKRAAAKDGPWFLMVNMPNSHRPYPNSDKVKIDVDPQDVELPQFLPDSPPVRKDWAEYLAGIEVVDAIVGRTIESLQKSGEQDNTIIIYYSDHGPTFQHGKMTLYDLGLRVPLIFAGPGIQTGSTSALASGVDLLPTLIELLERQAGRRMQIPTAPRIAIEKDSQQETGRFPYPIHGQSLAEIIHQKPGAAPRECVFAEISNRGPLPNKGIQERSVFDGRWKLIYRENVTRAWRQVNADSRQFKVWGNRTYAETIRLKDKFPKQYQILAEMDPQNLGGKVPVLELYDLRSDPDEMRNLADEPIHRSEQDRLLDALRNWVKSTNDPAVNP